jgi:hypothetical protein
MHSFQYDSSFYLDCNDEEYHFHQLNSHDSMDVSSGVEHHTGNRVVEAQDQLEPLG